MLRTLAVLAVALAVSCGGSATVVTGPSASASVAAASVSRAPSTRLNGTVQSASATKLMLADGTSVTLAPTTRITRTDQATTADLRSGLFVAITAKQQPDGSLLASVVSIFSESLSRAVPPGQRPLPQGDLMTNAAIAAIDTVSATSFTVTFSGQSARVTLAPNAVILKQVDLTPGDLMAGAHVAVTVADGTAQSVQLQTP